MDSDFNEEFSSEEELDQVLYGLVESARKEMEADHGKVDILDVSRLRQIQFVYSALRYIMRGTDAVVSYKLNEPFRTMGSVSVEGPVLQFCNPNLFTRIAGLASNTEVYPLVSNKVRLTFTFHGLTKPIE